MGARSDGDAKCPADIADPPTKAITLSAAEGTGAPATMLSVDHSGAYYCTCAPAPSPSFPVEDALS